jgi:hypothetical protein
LERLKWCKENNERNERFRHYVKEVWSTASMDLDPNLLNNIHERFRQNAIRTKKWVLGGDDTVEQLDQTYNNGVGGWVMGVKIGAPSISSSASPVTSKEEMLQRLAEATERRQRLECIIEGIRTTLAEFEAERAKRLAEEAPDILEAEHTVVGVLEAREDPAERAAGAVNMTTGELRDRPERWESLAWLTDYDQKMARLRDVIQQGEKTLREVVETEEDFQRTWSARHWD